MNITESKVEIRALGNLPQEGDCLSFATTSKYDEDCTNLDEKGRLYIEYVRKLGKLACQIEGTTEPRGEAFRAYIAFSKQPFDIGSGEIVIYHDDE
jgi:hypothetical protein